MSMFRRKLKALGYHHPSFQVNNEDEFRNLVVWLEDQKIRYYRIEEREELRDTKKNEWTKTFKKYLDDLQCPLDFSQKLSVVDWLLSHAVRVEYAENAEMYNAVGQTVKKEEVELVGESSLDDSLINLTVDNPDLKAGVASLSRLLSLPEHPDHFVLLQAIRSLIEGKLSSFASKTKKKSNQNAEDVIPLHKVDLGFDTGDSAVNEAAKIIRLLHVTELRDLQTRINEAIVAVQAITANPKTDQSLGRIGV
ncbi:RNA transcription, translation and transport factor protein isoform X1 [Pocillopora verrucosa]|uniref:RNA transcription, translation and transport factor protein isoform X1 n=1 Tax=Pocillopora verrucosa TaxID=203993 RepID=UPI0027972946|nr:RNA transcription, translation and transport factor protein-like isoform X1 [Pocillopora verrucosa]